MDSQTSESQPAVSQSAPNGGGAVILGSWSWHQPGDHGQSPLTEQLAAQQRGKQTASPRDTHKISSGHKDSHEQSRSTHPSSDEMKVDPAPNGPVVSSQYQGSAHNLYNSYAPNPWSVYPSQGQESGGSPIESLNKAHQSELQHLRNALSEKTKEVQRLVQELEKAYNIIETLKQHSLQVHHAQSQHHLQNQGQEKSEQDVSGQVDDK